MQTLFLRFGCSSFFSSSQLSPATPLRRAASLISRFPWYALCDHRRTRQRHHRRLYRLWNGCCAAGPEPFPLERVYTSSDTEESFFGTGWRLKPHLFRYFAMQFLPVTRVHATSKTAKNFFVVTDGLGAKMTYLGLHDKAQIAGGYRVDKKLWKKGMTNVSGNGISEKPMSKTARRGLTPKRGLSATAMAISALSGKRRVNTARSSVPSHKKAKAQSSPGNLFFLRTTILKT